MNNYGIRAKLIICTKLSEDLPMVRRYRGLSFIQYSVECFMHKFVIERQIPGAGKMSLSEIQTVARRSVTVLASLGAEIQWVESYITGDKIYCIYLASDAELIREHGRLSSIPVNSVEQVSRVMDPTIAEAQV
jgi:hypothetical protein